MKAARMIVAGAMVAGLASAVWLMRRSTTLTSTAAASLPCPPSVSPLEAWRRGLFVFEGIVVDRWPHTTRTGDGRVVTIRKYRFHVVRSWSRLSAPAIELNHGWSEGTPYLRGRYRVFERGGRYLVFAGTYDMPPSTFSTSCMPGAEGADIAAMAARLGPPVATFSEAGRPHVPFWVPVGRAALDWVRIVSIAVDGPGTRSTVPTR
jgi:hypothetical protein